MSHRNALRATCFYSFPALADNTLYFIYILCLIYVKYYVLLLLLMTSFVNQIHFILPSCVTISEQCAHFFAWNMFAIRNLHFPSAVCTSHSPILVSSFQCYCHFLKACPVKV